MAYCTQDDLAKLIPAQDLIDLTTETGETPDADVIAEAIAKGDAEIDSYLAVHYQTPLSPVPAQVKGLSMDLAAYYLYSRRSVLPPVREKNYENAIAFLKNVVAGKAVIVGASGAEPGSVDSDVVEVTSASRVFTRNDMGNW